MKDYTERIQQLQISLATALTFILALLTAYALLQANGVQMGDWRTSSFIAWGVCLVAYALSERLAGDIEGGLWAGYLLFFGMVVMLIFGWVASMLMILLGTATIRFLYSRWMPLAGSRLTAQQAYNTAYKRIAIVGWSVSGGALLLHLATAGRNDWHAEILLTLVICVLCLGLTQLIGLLLVATPQNDVRGFLHPNQYRRLPGEVVLLALIIPLALVYRENGAVLFGAVIGILAAQAIRHQQIVMTEDALRRRIAELSIISDVSQRMNASLVTDELYNRLADWACQMNFNAFFIALSDASKHISYPLITRAARRFDQNTQPFSDDHFLHQIIRQHGAINGDIVPTSERVTDDAGRPARLYRLPLQVGDKSVGLLVIVETLTDDAPSLGQSASEALATQIGLSIRNATLYGRTVKLAESLQYINHSVQDVLFNADQQGAIDTACHTVMTVTAAVGAAIFTRQDGKLRFNAAFGLTAAHRQHYQEGRHLPIVQDAALFYHDLRLVEMSTPYHALMTDGEFVAVAQVPLMSAHNITGLMVVFHAEPHLYHDAERELLGTVAHQLVTAMDNAYLLTTLESYALEQTQLLHLSRMSSSSLDLENMVMAVVRVVQHMLRVKWVGIGLMADDGESVQLYHVDSPHPQIIPLARWPELDAACKLGDTTFITIERADNGLSHNMRDWLHAQKLESLGAMVMRVDERTVGVLLLGQAFRYRFTDSEARLLEVARNQIATQVYNALQYRQTQESLTLRLQQLGLIESIAQQMAGALNIESLTRSLLQASLHVTMADMAALSLLTKAGDVQVMMLQVEPGANEPIFTNVHRMPSGGTVLEVFDTGQTLLIPDNSKHAAYIDALGRTYHSSLVLPLIHNDVVIGVLNLESDRHDYFSYDQATFLSSLAGHAVVSIQNTYLLQERQDQIEMLDALRALSVRLSVELNEEVALKAILKTAMDVLRGHAVVLVHFDRDDETFSTHMTLGRDAYVRVLNDYITFVALESIYTGEVTIQTYEDDPSCRAVIAIPVKADDKVHLLGVMTPDWPRDNDLNTATLIGIQAVAYLQNVALHHRIRAQNSRMQTILDSVQDGLILFHPSGVIIDVNNSASNLLGVDLHGYVGRPVDGELLAFVQRNTPSGRSPELPTLLQTIATHLRDRSGGVVAGAMEVWRPDGTRYLHHVSAPVLDGQGGFAGRLLALRDVTESQQLAAYRDEIASMVVHDLRGPLGSVITSLDVLRECIVEGGDLQDALELLGLLTNSGNRMLNLVNTLLDVSKLEQRRMMIDPVRASLADMVREALDSLKGWIDEGNLTVNIDIPPDLPDVFADAGKIQRVLINLLDNAMRYAPDDGEVLVRAMSDDGKIRVLVADSGNGIPEDKATHVFGKFVQGDSDHEMQRRGQRGSGLGLTYCYLALDAHGEKIWIDHQNSPLRGACFVFKLPQYVAD
ncbi:MAG: GAF domain-containing protein [Anaerolineaceae bacterium]|nr:MAG: GAF domain-containing protein [Anaerolineaceae bacterium]